MSPLLRATSRKEEERDIHSKNHSKNLKSIDRKIAENLITRRIFHHLMPFGNDDCIDTKEKKIVLIRIREIASIISIFPRSVIIRV